MDTERNTIQADLIKRGLEKLKNNIKKLPKNEIEAEKPNKIVDAVVEILDFNNQNQERQGLKILTTEQMFSRLPISLGQLKAGNNFEKL